MDYYEIGQKIRHFRKANGVSQEELAEKIGISTTHMSHIETGNTKLSLPVLVSIAEALEVRCDDLLFIRAVSSRTDKIEEFVFLLEDCSIQEMDILYDSLKSIKASIRKYNYS